ncbi:hypothetical protein MASR1M6_27150 [Rubrivivax sp.]
MTSMCAPTPTMRRCCCRRRATRAGEAAASLTWRIEADAADHATAIVGMRARRKLAGLPATRPVRLLHRKAPVDPAYAEVARTTAVCYVGAAR